MSNERGISFGKDVVAAASKEFANNRAHVIGINAYRNGVLQLRTVVADAQKLGELLAEWHGYTVVALPRDGQPSLATLRKLFHETLPQEVGANDRVLVYFAGHGIA